MIIIIEVTEQQKSEIKDILRKLATFRKENGYSVTLDFANKYTAEEMMMRVAMSYSKNT